MASDYNIIASTQSFHMNDGSMSQSLEDGTLNSIQFGSENNSTLEM